MPGHVHYKVGYSEDACGQLKDSPTEDTAVDAVQKVLQAMPPRSITDAFVNHFLNVVNYRYSAIYGPTLAERYVQWWTDRSLGKKLSPEFTCLLLRICAYSVQYLTPELRKMIEFELACTSQTLTERFSEAADELSRSFAASKTCIERVQEQFMKGAWLKSESKIVESWHTLSRVIREAQELGIDKDERGDQLCEFDVEIRRRIWTLLYIWDWQMSAWLGRPNLIDQKNFTFKFPNLRLDQSVKEPNLLSPFAHMALQANLGRRVATVMGDVTSTSDLSAEKVLQVERECEKFIEELPAIFRIKNPDTSLDQAHPYFVFQRHQLHCVIFVTMLDFFKIYLTRERSDKLTDRDDEFRKKGVVIALRLLKDAHKLFEHEFPINAKFHMVVFCIFDTSTVLCSAMIHDREHMLPHREKIVNIIDTSLNMLHQLSLTSKLGATSYIFLSKLVQATPTLSRHAPVSKRQRHDQSEPYSKPANLQTAPVAIAPLHDTASAPYLGPAAEDPSCTADALATIPISDDLAFEIDQFLAQNPFGTVTHSIPDAVDMGGMEQIWDWQNLNLDAFPQQGLLGTDVAAQASSGL
ncbi:hypothetical protein ACJQWK_03872 [Exserohilum turcicum]